MLAFLTIVVMLIVAYAFAREGLMTAFTMLCNVVLAGLVAFDFWEPIAAELDPMFAGSFLHGYEDALCLVLLFSLTLGLLRLVTNNLARTQLKLQPLAQQIGAVVLGLVTGYLTAGFLACVLQTLPLNQHFLNFDATVESADRSKIRRVLPPDRIWLAMMHRASMGPFATATTTPFDPQGSFELRYRRLRRYPDAEESAGK